MDAAAELGVPAVGWGLVRPGQGPGRPLRSMGCRVRSVLGAGCWLLALHPDLQQLAAPVAAVAPAQAPVLARAPSAVVEDVPAAAEEVVVAVEATWLLIHPCKWNVVFR